MDTFLPLLLLVLVRSANFLVLFDFGWAISRSRRILRSLRRYLHATQNSRYLDGWPHKRFCGSFSTRKPLRKSSEFLASAVTINSRYQFLSEKLSFVLWEEGILLRRLSSPRVTVLVLFPVLGKPCRDFPFPRKIYFIRFLDLFLLYFLTVG